MSKFNPEHKDISTLPKDMTETKSWVVLESEYKGTPLIVRCNRAGDGWVGHPDLPIKLGFAVPLKKPNPKSLPTAEENTELDRVEDVIVREVETNAQGIFALVLTTGTMKEWVFYIRPGANVQYIHESVRKQVQTHDVQCMAVKEPTWSSYNRFAPNAG